ncbi:hypothetical protein [Pendulispora albinea]|uniref:Uncharacterized protein n=1 Tax=Pendulispora albinea TaxID=2741071 RepID=A0ABZ2LWC2_9BACT
MERAARNPVAVDVPAEHDQSTSTTTTDIAGTDTRTRPLAPDRLRLYPGLGLLELVHGPAVLAAVVVEVVDQRRRIARANIVVAFGAADGDHGRALDVLDGLDVRLALVASVDAARGRSNLAVMVIKRDSPYERADPSRSIRTPCDADPPSARHFRSLAHTVVGKIVYDELIVDVQARAVVRRGTVEPTSGIGSFERDPAIPHYGIEVDSR